MAKKVKLQDIAERLGVSQVTVSKALSGQKGVSDEMRDRIKEYAKEIGYLSPTEAKQVNKPSSYNIGVVVAERYFGFNQSFYWMMYQEVATQAIDEKCFTMLEIVNSEDERQGVLPKLVTEEKVDGVIFLGSLSDSYIKMIEDKVELPYVFLDFYSKSDKSNSVISDSFYGMYMLVNYLFEQGHRKIYYVGTLGTTQSIIDRYFGYSKACMEQGQQFEDTMIINDRDAETGRLYEHDEIILPDKLPTAFACNSDATAYVLITALKERGIKVPEDVSIVGFDNYSNIIDSTVGVTTYETDIKEMVFKTFEKLIKYIEGTDAKTEIEIVSGNIVIKDSVRKIN